MLKQNPCFRHLAAAFYTLLLTCTFAPTSLATIAQHDRAFYKFQTRPDIDAPVFNVHVYDAKAVSPGYWFVAPYGHLHQKTPGQGWVGPHIYDNHGELIWSGAPMLGHWNAFDFESRVVGGDRMLTFLSDHESHGFILNSSYQLHRKVALAPSRGAKPNMHEFNVFGDGKRALILTHTQEHAAKEAVQSLGLPWPCLVHYQGFKDVSLDPSDPTGTLFEWDASQHIGLDEVTYRKYDGTPQQQCKRGWDILHLNSVSRFPDGDYLLSARHTDTVYKISHHDGSIRWRLGGLKSDFGRGDWNFSRQHHSRVLEQNATHTTLTVFDNGIGDGPFEKPSSDHARALTLVLDTSAMTVDVAGQCNQPRGIRTNARGSFQTLPNGNKFICWAYHSLISEHGPDDSLIMEAQLQVNLVSYRAFKHPWFGLPTRPPDIRSSSVHVDGIPVTIIYVSWNGDTQTAVWEFYGVNGNGTTYTLGRVSRRGFESKYEYRGFAARVFAEARSANGSGIGRSGIFETHITSSLAELEGEAMGEKEVDGGRDDTDEGQIIVSGWSHALEFVAGFTCGCLLFAILCAIILKYRWAVPGRDGIRYLPLENTK